MPTRNIERILGQAAHEILARIDAAPHAGPVRTQAAVVRSLINELDHHRSPDTCAPHLRSQVNEEIVRLMRLMNGVRAAAPVLLPVPIELRETG